MDFLAQMPQMAWLALDNTQVTNLTFLESMTNLYTLDLSYVPAVSVTPIYNLPNSWNLANFYVRGLGLTNMTLRGGDDQSGFNQLRGRTTSPTSRPWAGRLEPQLARVGQQPCQQPRAPGRENQSGGPLSSTPTWSNLGPLAGDTNLNSMSFYAQRRVRLDAAGRFDQVTGWSCPATSCARPPVWPV